MNNTANSAITYKIRPSAWNLIGMLLGSMEILGGLVGGSGGIVLLGLVLATAGALFWSAKKAILTPKSLIVKSLTKKRTIPLSKIETIELDRGLAGLRVAVSGTGSTRTLVSALKSQELHDILEERIGHTQK